MLNELMVGRFKCPFCGRIFYGPLLHYWCPFCGMSEESPLPEKTEDTKRLTARDEDGVPYYNGVHTFKSKTYAPEMSMRAIMEVLEKLCELEEEKENEQLQSNDGM